MATKVFEGKYKNSSDQIYLVDNGRFYKGKYSNSSDELKNIKPAGINIQDNKVFKGKNHNSSDQILLIDDEKIFEGKYSNSSNQIAIIDGDTLTEEENFTLMYLLAQRNNLI
jgi:hypothetical protein